MEATATTLPAPTPRATPRLHALAAALAVGGAVLLLSACGSAPRQDPGASSGEAGVAVAKKSGRGGGYYLDDGLYGSYSGQLFDHAKYPVESLKQAEEKFPSVLAGPTCDSIDVIAENLMLPQLKAGDLVVGRAMGAYTWASASEFNFFPKATVVSVNRRPGDTGSVVSLPF